MHSVLCKLIVFCTIMQTQSKSLEGAFNSGGRLLLCLLQNSCTAAVIVLFLGCCLSLNLFLSLNLSHRSALCVGISLSAIDAS